MAIQCRHFVRTRSGGRPCRPVQAFPYSAAHFRFVAVTLSVFMEEHKTFFLLSDRPIYDFSAFNLEIFLRSQKEIRKSQKSKKICRYCLTFCLAVTIII